MGIIIYSFNLNISPKRSYGVLECDVVTELHAYDFVIKRGITCARPCIYVSYLRAGSCPIYLSILSINSMHITLENYNC